MEYLRICREEQFENVVLSIKASNTRVMVHTVRLLVARMEKENMHFPLHLGVTEAGSGEDGRLKSAVGIGALLADGMGDTIRVSLTEPPENEIPVARKLVEYFRERGECVPVQEVDDKYYSPFDYRKRKTYSVLNAGGENPAVVVADIRNREIPEEPKEIPEFVLCNSDQFDELPAGWAGVIRIVEHSEASEIDSDKLLPLFDISEKWVAESGPVVVVIRNSGFTDEIIGYLRQKEDVILLLESDHINSTADQRAFFMQMQNKGLKHPVIVWKQYNDSDEEDFRIKSAADTGLLFLDGYGDGICLSGKQQQVAFLVSIAFGILQASRVRFSKTEYISCPGCGRTLFDLQSTTGKVREKTAHLKGLKIAVMGCIVNGIGEMADADYGYVGAGPGRISLFRNRELIRKSIPDKDAVEELVTLIKEYGDWVDPAE
jgi:(E)-4-hydroxy-3-methylbut-2-enyl-diphosphate synthase